MRRVLVVSAALTCAVGAATGAAPAAAGEPVFVVTGRGWGHGVGMGQWGARGFAARGWRYDRILAHYYRGTRLGRAPLQRVRVLLADGRTRVRLGSKKPFRVVDARGRRVVVKHGGVFLGPRLLLRLPGRKTLRLVPPVRFEPGAMPMRIDTAPYRGALVVHRSGRSLQVVNDVDLELYLRGVVPWEMPHEWPHEALKAQAVVARSYAIATLHPGQTYDLLPDTRDQVYGGLVAEKPETNRAIGATTRQVLFHGLQVATTYYHSTSGGRTASICDVWPKVPCIPYLRSVADPHETASPHHTWGPFVLTPGQLARKLRVRKPDDAVVERNGSGRALAVVLGGRRVGERDFRSALGLRSSWFELGVMRLDAAPPATYGSALELTGIARGVRGAAVERRDAGRWRQVARVRVGESGRFRARVRALATEFRVAGGGVAAPPVRVRLAPHVQLRAAGEGLGGVVRPALPRAAVRIQLDVGGVWEAVATVRVDARGAFRAPNWLEPGRYRAWLAPTRGFLAAASRPLERL